jgi:hypothetical protein
MAGSKNGFVSVQMVGCRVATRDVNPMRYTPAHRKPDGTLVSARLEIPVMVNEYNSKAPDAYKLVAWGGRADLFAKSLSKGKEMNFELKPKSYFRRVYNKANQQLMQPDGVEPVQVRALSFKIVNFTWGADAEAQKSLEIASGIRKEGWDNPNSPAHAEWMQTLQNRKNLFYQGGDKFGYAVVVQPPQGCTVLFGDQSAIARNNQGASTQTTELVNQVAQTLDPATGFPMTGNTLAAGVAPAGNAQAV